MTESADLTRLGIGIRADPAPLRMPGEDRRRRRVRVLAWLILGFGACLAAAGALVVAFSP